MSTSYYLVEPKSDTYIDLDSIRMLIGSPIDKPMDFSEFVDQWYDLGRTSADGGDFRNKQNLFVLYKILWFMNKFNGKEILLLDDNRFIDYTLDKHGEDWRRNMRNVTND